MAILFSFTIVCCYFFLSYACAKTGEEMSHKRRWSLGERWKECSLDSPKNVSAAPYCSARKYGVVCVGRNGAVKERTCSYTDFMIDYRCNGYSGYIYVRELNKCIKTMPTKDFWESANIECTKIHGFLLTLTTERIVIKFAKLQGTRFTGRGTHASAFWLGLDIHAGMWVNGEKVTPNVSRHIPSTSTGQDCVAIKPTREWVRFSCSNKLSYYCESPVGHGLFSPHIDLKQGPLDPGKPVNATCSGYAGHYCEIVFELKVDPLGESRLYDASDEEVIYLEDREYVKSSNLCERRSKAIWAGIATDLISGSLLSCCMRDIWDNKACTLPVTLRVFYKTEQPNVTIHFHAPPNFALDGWTLKAVCEVRSGKGESLSAYLTMPGTSLNFVIDKRNMKKRTPVMDFKTRFWHHKLEISLKFHKINDNTILVCATGATESQSSIIKVRDPPKKPKLTVNYHRTPNEVFNLKDLILRCEVAMHFVDKVIWELTTLTRTFVWPAFVNGSHISAGHLAHITVTQTLQAKTSELRVKVKSEFVAATFGCHVIVHANVSLPKTLKLTALSHPLRVIYSRQKPELEYKDVRSNEYKKRAVLVTCSAFVGTRGSLTLGLLRQDDSFRAWSIDTESTIKGVKNADSYVWKRRDAKMDYYMGPKVTAQVRILLSEENPKTEMFCFSYDVFLNFSESASLNRTDEMRVAAFPFAVTGALLSEPTNSDAIFPWFHVAMYMATSIMMLFALYVLLRSRRYDIEAGTRSERDPSEKTSSDTVIDRDSSEFEYERTSLSLRKINDSLLFKNRDMADANLSM